MEDRYEVTIEHQDRLQKGNIIFELACRVCEAWTIEKVVVTTWVEDDYFSMNRYSKYFCPRGHTG